MLRDLVAHYAVTAIGADRPGIVAALTGALYELGGNLEDVASSILRGHFAIMLVVDGPEGTTGDGLSEALERAAGPLGVSVAVREVETGTPRRSNATHALVAYAADRPGIVAGLTKLLSEQEANITDLSCRLTGEEPHLYVMVAEVVVPGDAESLGGAIDARASELGVDVTFRPIDADTL